MKASKEENYNKILKQKFDNFEFPYDATSWPLLEQKLRRAQAGSSLWTKAGIGIASAIIIIAVAYFSFFQNNNESSSENELKISELQTQQLSVPDSIMVSTNNQNVSGVIKEEYKNKENDKPIVQNTKPQSTQSKIKSGHPTSKKQNKLIPQYENLSALQENKVASASLNPNAGFAASAVNGCPPLIVHFQAEELCDTAFYLWKSGDGQISTDPNPDFSYENPGTFSVELTVSYSMSGASSTNVKEDMVEVYPLPNASFTFENEANLYRFTPADLNQKNYSWTITDLEIPNQIIAEYRFVKSGIYPVQLSVSNSFECVSKQTMQVEVIIGYQVFMPNAFTPDGDGRNDLFGPDPSKLFDLNYHFEVISREGKVVFSTNDVNEKWNGTIRNSSDQASSGIYVWKIVLKDRYGNTQNEMGNVTLIRNF